MKNQNVDPKMSKTWHKAQVDEFIENWTKYETMEKLIAVILKDIATKIDCTAIVETRTKKVSSFAEKLIRKWRKYQLQGKAITDLTGGRIIAHTQSQVEAMKADVGRKFEIVEEDDASERLSVQEFGYRSVHYIVTLKTDDQYVAGGESAFVTFLDNANPSWRDLIGLKAEVQVRTLLQHAWADIIHERLYKNEFKVPLEWHRISTRLAAVLENADNTFVGLVNSVDAYKSYFGAYMSKEELLEEVNTLKTIQEADPQNTEVALQICKISHALADWDTIIEHLDKDEKRRSDLRVDASFALLRELGNARYQKHTMAPDSSEFKQGQDDLIRSLALNENADTHAFLAATWEPRETHLYGVVKENAQKALTHYRKAYELSSDNPYHFCSFITFEIANSNDYRVGDLMKKLAREAVDKCKEHILGGIEFPRAHFTIGRLSLLLGDEHQSRLAYVTAIRNCIVNKGVIPRSIIRSEIQAISSLLDAGGPVGVFECARGLLVLAEAAVYDDCDALKSENIFAAKESLKGPIVILAGGCREEVSEKLKKTYGAVVRKAFRNFNGTIISGGTQEGVSGIAGSIKDAYGDQEIDLMAYLPTHLPDDAHEDERYRRIKTKATGFSPMEPIRSWADIIVSGIKPEAVKLIGIGGGEISAFEYRLALALGAKVAIIPKSGDAADAILSDDDWANNENLIPLPVSTSEGASKDDAGGVDEKTLAELVVHPVSPMRQHRETLAKGCHQSYLEQQKQEALQDLSKFQAKPSLVPWEKLGDVFKESSRKQADHIHRKLGLIDCDIVETVEGAGEPAFRFTPVELNRLSEQEHGRWNVEKLLDGYRCSAKRDDIKKHHPDILPWNELKEGAKNWDRNAIETIPEILARVGLGIRRR